MHGTGVVVTHTGMKALRIILPALLLSLAACARVRTTEGTSVPVVTQKIERGFFKAGGSLQRFFTGKDTLSDRE